MMPAEQARRIFGERLFTQVHGRLGFSEGWSTEARRRCEGYYNFWWRGYKCTLTDVVFVAGLILAALV
jgi:hypothetical protein